MSFDCLPIDVSQSLHRRSDTRTRWEADFETNHTAFAEAIALGLFQRTRAKFDQRLQDPYQKEPDVDNKHFISFSLDMTRLDEKKTKHLKKLVGPAADFAPFNEWIEKFTIVQDPFPYAPRKRLKGIDKDYFQDLMALVGQKAAEKLQTLFTDYMSRQENRNLLFRVEWYRRAEKLLSNPSNFSDNCINIQLWLGPQAKIPTATALTTSSSITQHRNQTEELKRKQTRNKALIMFTASVVFLIIMGILHKNASKTEFD